MKDKCLNPKCDKPERARGLCSSCYVTAIRLIKAGDTSWKELEKNGKVLVPNKRGNKGVVKNWLLGKND